MIDDCENCGYGKGLHRANDYACPKGGEAPVDKEQEWLETHFEKKEESPECCFCKCIEGALIKLYQGWCCVPCFKKTILEVPSSKKNN